MMNKACKVFAAGSVAAVAVLAGCMSGGPGGSPFGRGGVEGEWLSTDGVALSRFTSGAFETVATDTGNKLANGTYQTVELTHGNDHRQLGHPANSDRVQLHARKPQPA